MHAGVSGQNWFRWAPAGSGGDTGCGECGERKEGEKGQERWERKGREEGGYERHASHFVTFSPRFLEGAWSDVIFTLTCEDCILLLLFQPYKTH